jgi:hypothetical protein
MSAVNWGEVYHATWRERVKDVAERIVAEISHLPIEIEHANFEATKRRRNSRRSARLLTPVVLRPACRDGETRR